MIDPIWNDCANDTYSYKNVLLDAYTSEAFELKKIPHAVGMDLLAKTLKNAAMTLTSSA